MTEIDLLLREHRSAVRTAVARCARSGGRRVVLIIEDSDPAVSDAPLDATMPTLRSLGLMSEIATVPVDATPLLALAGDADPAVRHVEVRSLRAPRARRK